MQIAAVFIAAVGLILLSTLCLSIPNTATSGKLYRNSIMGLRTTQTKKSDAAWLQGHKEAAPILKVTGMLVIALTAVLLISAFFVQDVPFVSLTTGAISYVLAIGGIIWAAVIADKAAKKVNNQVAA
ncbi:SdpI family protein [Corynebacterium sp. sy017]|uniref:SdpI family protein n=1 Tax=unclassified Corynebacterium TaxID=2624378 RepID=UPI0011858827|nr:MULTISPECIES: SdpI family protein [unclassified Corynebacterium]MBP3088042.1 SdpI family protein [Corynebacterium sp. sy017]QDZ42997.1 SdpI family protein [Corynebacterium sp. sy039]TSD92570.1 SdpI family protein [Corynebacterium sp. SY003]